MTKAKQGRKGGRPAGSDAEKTHEAIVVAARRRFAQHGYLRTKNEWIADDAGVTTSTLYHYFRNKLDLYVTVFRYADRTLARRYQAAVEGTKDEEARMRSVLAEAVRVYQEDPSIPIFLASVPVEMRHDRDIARAIAACPIETSEVLRTAYDRTRGDQAQHPNQVDASIRFFFAVTVGVVLYARPEIESDYASMIRGFEGMLARSGW